MSFDKELEIIKERAIEKGLVNIAEVFQCLIPLAKLEIESKTTASFEIEELKAERDTLRAQLESKTTELHQREEDIKSLLNLSDILKQKALQQRETIMKQEADIENGRNLIKLALADLEAKDA